MPRHHCLAKELFFLLYIRINKERPVQKFTNSDGLVNLMSPLLWHQMKSLDDGPQYTSRVM